MYLVILTISLKVTLIKCKHHDVESFYIGIKNSYKQMVEINLHNKKVRICIFEPIIKVKVFIYDIYIDVVTNDLKDKWTYYRSNIC